jgi:hypothetical protein
VPSRRIPMFELFHSFPFSKGISRNREFRTMSRRAWFLVASLGLLAYGALCLVRFPIERRRAMAVPRMTCGQLFRKGPIAEEYVTLTDVRLCRGGFAFWRDAMSPGDVDVFVPAYPATLQSEPQPRDLKLLLEVQDADDWQRIRNAGAVELTCQVHIGSARVADGAQKHLETKYPGIQFANLVVLTVGLHEPTMAKAGSLWRHGIFASSAGAVLMVWLLWRRKTSTARSVPVSSEQL